MLWLFPKFHHAIVTTLPTRARVQDGPVSSPQCRYAGRGSQNGNHASRTCDRRPVPFPRPWPQFHRLDEVRNSIVSDKRTNRQITAISIPGSLLFFVGHDSFSVQTGVHFMRSRRRHKTFRVAPSGLPDEEVIAAAFVAWSVSGCDRRRLIKEK